MKKTDVAVLKQLLESSGWQVVKEHLEKNLTWLTDIILDDTDESLKEPIQLNKREMFIKWRKYNELLLKTPESLIESLESGNPIEQPTEFDPYRKEKEFEHGTK